VNMMREGMCPACCESASFIAARVRWRFYRKQHSYPTTTNSFLWQMDHSLREAIVCLHRNVPLLEQHLVEIGELRERLTKKEQEVNETLCQSKTVLSWLAKELLVGSSGISPLHLETLSESGEGEMKTAELEPRPKRRRGDDRLDPPLLVLADSKISEMGSLSRPAPPSSSSLSLSQEMDERTVADLLLKQSRDSLSVRQRAIEAALAKTKREEERVSGEIVERDAGLLERSLEETKEMVEKLRGHRESLPLLASDEEKFNRELQECESEIHRLDSTVRADLVAAMEWARRESGGLYRPSVCSAPVMLLLFQQFCRQHVSFKAKKKGEAVTVDRLRRVGCSAFGVKKAGYDAGEARAGGFTVRELGDLMGSGGYSSEEIGRAGYSLKEMRDGGFAVLMKLGCTFAQLRQAGFTTKDLGSAVCNSSYPKLLAAGYSLQELRAGGITCSSLKSLGYTLAQLIEMGFTAKDLRVGGAYSVTEILGAGSLQDLRDAAIPAWEWKRSNYTVSQLRQAGFTLRKIGQIPEKEALEAGYSLQEIIGGGQAAELKSLGYTAAQLRQAGFTVKGLIAVGDRRPAQMIGRFQKIVKAGFSFQEIAEAGFSIQEMREGGLSLWKVFGYTASQLRAGGCDVSELRAGGYSLQEVQQAGYSPEEVAVVSAEGWEAGR
jgi:biotin operon repressor